MNKLIVALALVLTSSLSLAQAGDNSGAKGEPGQKGARAERMQNDLGLTDEQVKKMREIRNGGGTREEMQAVLTPEQRQKAAQLRKERQGDREARKTQMQKELGITEEQQKKLDEIRKNHGSREEMRAVLTPEQQAKFDAIRSKHGKGGKPPAKPALSSAAKPAPAAPTAKPTATPATETPASDAK